MNGKTRSLWWKEWREQRWKAAFGAVILGSFTAIGLRTRIIEDQGILVLSMGIGSFIFPLIVVMGLVAAEHAEGSLRSLLALPESPGRILGVKLLVGLIAYALPIGVAGLFAVLMAGGREQTTSYILQCYLYIGWLGVQVMVWTLALGIAEPNEYRTALAGVGGLLIWLIWGLIADDVFPNQKWLWQFHPAYEFDMLPNGLLKVNVVGLVVEALEVAALLAVAAYRFRKLARRA